MASEPTFRDKFVAFVDILGFKSKVEAAEQCANSQLSDLLDICRELENQPHIQSIAGYGPIICPESRYNCKDLGYEVTQISDCAVISVEVSPAGIINLLAHVSQSILGLLNYGVMVRGCVTQGRIFHNKKQFIGTGYQNARSGEQSVRAFRILEGDGATPFVEIAPDVVQYIKNETDACVLEIFGRLTKEDKDHGVTVLFPFRQFTNVAGGNIGEPEQCNKDLDVIRDWINDYREKIDFQSPASDPESNQKSKYYRNILDDILAECDEIQNSLELSKQPAVKLRYDKDFNVVWDG